MKPGEVKRALMVLSLLCIFVFFYLYWQQSTPLGVGLNGQAAFYKYKRRFYNYIGKSSRPQWTWQCVNQHCERHLHSDDVPQVSLSTCSMMCGSTQLWPQPSGPVTLGSRAATFHPKDLQLIISAPPGESSTPSGSSDTVSSTKNTGPLLLADQVRGLVDNAFRTLNDSASALIRDPLYHKQPTEIRRVIVVVELGDFACVRLKLSTDESYKLTVRPKNDEVEARIVAKTFFGARHALETLSQLMWWDEYAGTSGMLKILKGAKIEDAPVFAYRGLMVDTARNYMSIDGLKRVLDGMSANKLNVFHWHVSDSHSFPLVSNRVPQLAAYGAYSPAMVYTPHQVENLVEYARGRGIRVVLEVDTPAHAGNGWTWGPSEGLGDLAVCVNEKPWTLYCGEPPCGQLNPDNPNVYDILEKIYKDLLDMTQETELFHLGGDEVNLECWSQFLPRKPNGSLDVYADLHDLWGDFTLKALKSLETANGNRPMDAIIVWSSNLSKRPYVTKYFNKSSIIVQSWGGSTWSDTPDLLADGYRVLVSHVDAWYLDCGFGRWRETGDAACDPYRPWQTFYNHRPWQAHRAANRKQIIGGEACLWSEQVDEGSLDSRLWPRTAAFAERLWSDPEGGETGGGARAPIKEDVYTRLSTQRERLTSRGIGAEALWPGWCVQNPGMCL